MRHRASTPVPNNAVVVGSGDSPFGPENDVWEKPFPKVVADPPFGVYESVTSSEVAVGVIVIGAPGPPTKDAVVEPVNTPGESSTTVLRTDGFP